MGRLWRRSLSTAVLLTAVALAGSASFSAASTAGAEASSTVCSGTWAAPGTLTGTFSSVRVTGVCFVNNGPAVVTGSVIVARGAALVAAFAMNNSSLTVGGSILVQAGATLVLGCEASEAPCLDDPNQQPTLNGVDVVKGNLIATNALGVLVHNATIKGSVVQSGGGGGFNCNPDPVNLAFSFAVFSAYDDNSVGGGLSISQVTSCYMGVARNRVGGSVNIIGNHLADNDAIEILSNTIGGNLSCFGNSMTWNNVETGPDLFPRARVPINSVSGHRSGQCLLASPIVLGGLPGPGPF